MQRRVGARAAAVLIAATVALPATCHAADARSGPAADPPQVRLREDTTVEPDGEMVADISARIARSRTTWHDLQALLAIPAHYSVAYRAALVQALTVGGLLSEAQAESIVLDMRELPTVRISEEAATIFARTNGWQPWEASDGDSALSMRPLPVPDGDRLVVSLTVDGPVPESVWPLPNRDDADGHLLWEFGPGDTGQAKVQLGTPIDRSTYSPFRIGVSFLIEALPFVVLLALLVGGGGGLLPRRRLRRFGLAAIAVSVCAAAYYLYESIATLDEGDLLRMIAPTAGIAVFAALALPWRRRGRQVALALLVLSLGTALAVVVAHRSSLDVEFATLARNERSTLELVLACALATGLLAAAIWASARWFATVLPRVLRRRLPKPSTPLGAAVAFAVAAAVTLEIVLATHAQSYWDTFFNGEPGTSAALGSFLEFAPLTVADLTRNLAATVLIAGLAGWFWNRARGSEVTFSRWRERALFGLLFASSVVGISGQLGGYAFPLGFLVAMPLATLALHLLTRTKRAEALAQPSLRAEASSLLKRSVSLATVRQQRQAVQAGIRANQKSSDDLGPLDDKRQALLEGSGLTLFDPDEQEGEALALGLAAGLGARGRWLALGPVLWAILAGPIAYSALTVIDRQFSAATSAAQPAGLAFMFATLAFQVGIWPVAAWAFIVVEPILPGRIGPFKGVVAGLFCALPPGLATLFVEEVPGAASWLFLPAELTLVFVAIGLALDFQAVRRIRGDLRQLGELYSITSLRRAVAYLAPLAFLLLSVIHGLATGSGASALEGLFVSAETLIPGPH